MEAATSSLTSFASQARMFLWTSCACSGEAVFPVPMAQTGSYAMTTLVQSLTFAGGAPHPQRTTHVG